MGQETFNHLYLLKPCYPKAWSWCICSCYQSFKSIELIGNSGLPALKSALQS